MRQRISRWFATAAASRIAAAAIGMLLLTACAHHNGVQPAADARPQPVAPEAGFASALARGLPFVVGVYTVGRTDDGRAAAGDDVSIGAGFVLRADGLIVTAAHVVEGVREVIVKLADERVMIAELIASDEDADIALLKIAERWTAGPVFGHSAAVRAGDWVIAVGEPFGMQRTAVAGIVGGPLRHFAQDHAVAYIQTDLTLNPGHSGGPLFDAQGAIIGMNARAISGMQGMAGLSLALPIETVLQVAAGLESAPRSGKPPRFGAHFEDLLPPEAMAAGLARASGAVIRSIERATLAERLGLKANDIVVGLNGQPIGDSADMTMLLLDRPTAAPLRLTVFRGGAYRELRVD
jgi:serine protease Do